MAKSGDRRDSSQILKIVETVGLRDGQQLNDRLSGRRQRLTSATGMTLTYELLIFVQVINHLRIFYAPLLGLFFDLSQRPLSRTKAVH